MMTQDSGGNLAGDGPEERDPGLARERTSLAWTRTAISFAALGGTVLRVNVVTGLIILAVAPVIWQLGRVTRDGMPGTDLPASDLPASDLPASDLPASDLPASGLPIVGAARLFLIAVSIVAVALLCLIVAVFGRSVPGALR